MVIKPCDYQAGQAAAVISEYVAQAMEAEVFNTETVFAPSPEHPMKAARWAQLRFVGFGLFFAYSGAHGEFVAKWEGLNTWVHVPTEELVSCLYLLFEDARYVEPDGSLLDEELSKPWLPNQAKVLEVLRALGFLVPQLGSGSSN